MRHQNSLAAALTASMTAMFLSFIVHSPWSVPGIYSDIGSFWSRPEIQQGLVPYFQYFFEYPPLSGLIIYAARRIGETYDGYYTVFGVMSMAATLLLAWSCWRIANRLGTRLNPLYFFLPSVIVYGIYNFDLFNALFIILSIQFFLEGRRDASAVALGLSVALKLVGGVLLPIYLLELKGTKRRLTYLLFAAAAAGCFYLPLLLLKPSFLSQYYTFLRNWGLEDAWYIWIFQDPFSTAAKLFGTAVSVVLLLRVYTLKIPLVSKAFLGISAYLLGTYIYSPQFNLTLIPLVIVLAIDDPPLYPWEVFNALIILTWFLPPPPLPGFTCPGGSCQTLAWTIPQAMALVRSASLAWLCVVVLRRSGVRLVELLPSVLRQPKIRDFAPVSCAESPP